MVSTCSTRTIDWIYRRSWWLTPTSTPRPIACWSPAGKSSTTSPHSTGRRALCQDSMLLYWLDHTSIWRPPIIVLLVLLIFSYFDFNLFYYLFIFKIRTHTMKNPIMIHYYAVCSYDYYCYGIPGRRQYAIQVTVKEPKIMMITRYKSHINWQVRENSMPCRLQLIPYIVTDIVHCH